jgi:hypothetical protein
MSMRVKLRSVVPVVILLALTGLAACGDDDDGTVSSATTVPSATASTAAHDPGHGGTASTVAAAANACPVDGCRITISSAEREGAEIKLAFQANFTPDNSRNHFHVYWDRFDAKQVSNDAQTKHGVVQGDWEPTADNPFTTSGTVSVSARQESNRVCVTAGDRDHNVLDPTIVDCRDVGALLG